jgi:dTDP-4-dehydrorhamnose 3,5-epimerase
MSAMLHVESRHLNGALVLRPDVHKDARGFFFESFRSDYLAELDLPTDFQQDNHSHSSRGVIRGLHFQWDRPMAKLMRVTAGAAFVVAVDIRKGSPSLGQWHGIEVTAESLLQVWAPAGFARGFCALTDGTEVQYKCTATYNVQCESGIRWNDPDIGIEWPLSESQLSEKDAGAQTLAEWLARPESDRFRYEP